MFRFNKHPQKYRLELFEILTNKFNLQEFQTLCFAIPVNYDLLAGDNLGSKARELILDLMRKGRLEKLVATGRDLRPDIDWPQIPTSKTQKRDFKAIEEDFAPNSPSHIKLDVLDNKPSTFFTFIKGLVTMIFFAVIFQLFAGPLIQDVTCNIPPIPCISLESWWIVGAIIGFFTGVGLLDSSGNG